MLLAACLCAQAQVAVWTYHNNNQRTGLNDHETILTPANVNPATFGKLFSYPVDGYVYAQPLYIPNLNIQGHGIHNALFVATEHNTVYAFDADSGGAAGGLLWSTNLGPSAVTTIAGVYTNQNFGTRYNNGAYTDIVPEVGITGTPVIDTNTGTLYVDALTGELGGGITNYIHRLHALNITNGTEQPYSPVIVTASVPGNGIDSVGGVVTFNAMQENQRPALTLAGGIVYLAYAGYSDTDPYHGWVIGFNATNLMQLTNYVFNTTPNSTEADFGDNAGEGGIWMAGGGFAVDANTNLYFEVGNGSFNATNTMGITEYGDSFIKLSTTNGLAVADYFTPWNQAALQYADKDLGSGGVILLPDQSGGVTHELVGASKQGQIYVLNRDQFTTDNGHYDGTNTYDFIVQTNLGMINGSFGTPAYFNGRVYYGAQGDYLKGFALTNGLLSSTDVIVDNNGNGNIFWYPGTTPSISACGTNNGIVWALNYMPPQVLVACNATNFTTELYTSAQAPGNRDQLYNATKFAVPTVANGKVYVGGSNNVTVFGLFGGIISFSTTNYTVPQANTNAMITVSRLGGTNGAVQVSYATVPGGTAVQNLHYTAVSGVLNWADGETGAKTFTVPVFNDGLGESNLTVNLALSNPTNPASALGLQPTAMLTIVSSPSSVWKLAHFGINANNPAISGDTADPDQDGIPNLLEYAYAADPNTAGTNPFTGQLNGQQFELQFPRNTSAMDLTYQIQASSDLSTWSNILTYTAANGWTINLAGATVSEAVTNGTPPDQSVNVTTITTTNAISQTNQFFRLQIQR